MTLDEIEHLIITNSVMLSRNREVMEFTKVQRKHFKSRVDAFLRKRMFHLFSRNYGFMYYFGFVLVFIIILCSNNLSLDGFIKNKLLSLMLAWMLWDNLMSGDFLKFVKKLYVRFNYRLFIQKGLFTNVKSRSDYQVVYLGFISLSQCKKFRKRFYFSKSFPFRKSVVKDKPIICVVSSIDSLPVELSNVKQFIVTKHSLETVIVNYYLSNSTKEDYRTLCSDFYQIVHNDYLNYKIALERFR